MRRTFVTLLLLCAPASLALVAGAEARHRVAAHDLTATRAVQLKALREAATRRNLTVRIAKADARRRYWLRVMHRPVPPSASRVPRLPLGDLRRAAEWRTQRAVELARTAKRPPHLYAWLCIQRHETGGPYPAWRTNTGNGYYGGLQMDRGFQATYGPQLYRTKGSAENWTPLEQMWAAERAHASGRGFTPWPNTARACGVL